MKIKILCFGQASEVVGFSEGSMSLNDNCSLRNLQDLLFEKEPKLTSLNLKWAVNQELINDNIELKEGDEVAVLPPFAGG